MCAAEVACLKHYTDFYKFPSCCMEASGCMSLIISVSRRTDIPAFYAEWFMQRIRAQYCKTVNPFNKKQVSVVSLRPEDVDALVFWTKNARPLLPYLHELDELGYRYYFQYTINGYGKIF